MRTEEEIRKKLEFTEFIMDEYWRELQDLRIWNTFVELYWVFKWVLGETGVVQSSKPKVKQDE